MGADVYERSTPLASVASGADGWKEEKSATACMGVAAGLLTPCEPVKKKATAEPTAFS